MNLSPLNHALRSMTFSAQNATKLLAASLERVASGKRFTKASDDLGSYLKNVDVEIQIERFDRLQSTLGEYAARVNLTLDAANLVMDDLAAVKTLLTEMQDYAIGSDERKAKLAEAQGYEASIKETLSVNQTDGTDVLASKISGIELAGTGSLTVTYDTGSLLPDATLAYLTTSATASAASADIDNMVTYTGNVSKAVATLESQYSLAQTMYTNSEAVSSAITAIDDAAELAKIVDYQVRQQAAISMIAQANLSRSNMAALYTIID